MPGTTFETLQKKNQNHINSTRKDLVTQITQLSYMKGYEKGIDFTELVIANNNIEYLISIFKDKLRELKAYIIQKAEMFNVTYPQYSKIQSYYELKGELKAIKEFSKLYLNIDFHSILQGENL